MDEDDRRILAEEVATQFPQLCDADRETLAMVRVVRNAVTIGVNGEPGDENDKKLINAVEIGFTQMRAYIRSTIAPKLTDEQRDNLERNYLSVPFFNSGED